MYAQIKHFTRIQVANKIAGIIGPAGNVGCRRDTSNKHNRILLTKEQLQQAQRTNHQVQLMQQTLAKLTGTTKQNYIKENGVKGEHSQLEKLNFNRILSVCTKAAN
jgi:hypothetical protein